MSTNPERINTESLIPGTTIQESVLPETTNPSVSPETVIPAPTHPEAVIPGTTNPESASVMGSEIGTHH